MKRPSPRPAPTTASASASASAFRSVVLADARNAVLEDYGEAIGRCQSQEEFNELLDDTKWQLRTITEYEEPEEDEDA